MQKKDTFKIVNSFLSVLCQAYHPVYYVHIYVKVVAQKNVVELVIYTPHTRFTT